MSSGTSILNPVKDMPEYLYKYVSVKRALEVLLTQKVYFAHCEEFNDPFEGQFVFERDRGAGISETEYYNARKHFNKMKLGFFSMAEKWNSYPMWAHYANQHRGCCIRFNFSRLKSNWEKSFPFMFTERVKYIKESLGYKGAIKHLPHKYGSIYMSKLENWRYEEEWRAVMYDGEYKHYETEESMFDKRILDHAEFKKMKGGGMVYPLGKKFLDEIILGYNMTDTEKKTVFYVAKECNAKVNEVKFLKSRFGMELRPFKP